MIVTNPFSRNELLRPVSAVGPLSTQAQLDHQRITRGNPVPTASPLASQEPQVRTRTRWSRKASHTAVSAQIGHNLKVYLPTERSSTHCSFWRGYVRCMKP